MSRRSIIVDGHDLAELGFVMETDLRGWRDSVWREHQIQRIVNRTSSLVVSARAQSEPRDMVIRGAVTGSTMAELLSRHEEILFRLDRAWAREETLDVRFVDDEARIFRARLNGRVETRGVQPELVAFGRPAALHVIEIPLVCEDPLIYEEALTSVAFAQAATALPLRNGPVAPEFVVDVGSFTLRLRDAAGVEAAFLTLSGAPNPPITVDMEAQALRDANGDGVPWTALVQDGGDFFEVSPHLGDPYADPPELPTIETTAGNGTTDYQRSLLG